MTREELRAVLDGLSAEDKDHVLAYLEGYAPTELIRAIHIVKGDAL